MIIFDKKNEDNPTYYYLSDGISDQEFFEDAIIIWSKILFHIRADRADGSWNRLIFQCWLSDGFVEIYPQKRGESPDFKKPSIVVSVACLDEIRQKLEGEDDENEIRNLMALAYIKIRKAIRNSYRREPALSALKDALTSNDFTCWTTKEDDFETAMEFDIYF